MTALILSLRRRSAHPQLRELLLRILVALAAVQVVRLRWGWQCVKHQVQRPDGSWAAHQLEHGRDGVRRNRDGRAIEYFRYRLTKGNGEYEYRTARVYTYRREWRWSGLTWLPWPSRRRTAIDVEFNLEAGGMMSCSWTMKPGESREDCLRRMEAERRFD
jgi:hypothetical protein